MASISHLLTRRLARGLSKRLDTTFPGSTGASTLIGTEADGVAFDFRDQSLVIRDTVTPANNFSGDVNSWFTYTSPSTKWIRNSAGLLVSGTTLRTEYSAAGTALGVRIEPAQTGLVTNSSASGGMFLSNITATNNTTDVLSPTGDNNAMKFVVTSTGTAQAQINATAGGSATGNTGYVFVKKGSGATDLNQFILYNATTAAVVIAFTFNYDTGAVTYTTGSSGVITSQETNGWWRLDVSATTGISASDNVRLYVGCSGGAETAGETLYVWNPQIVAGLVGGTPIVTSGSTVTRAADNVTKLISAMPFSATAGTLFAEFSTASADLAGGSVWYAVSLNDGTVDEQMGVHRYQANVGGTVRDGAVTQADVTVAGVISGGYQMVRGALAFAANDIRASVNGTLSAADASATLPTPTRLELGRAGTNQIGGHMMRGLYVPRRVSNGDLPTFGGTA